MTVEDTETSSAISHTTLPKSIHGFRVLPPTMKHTA